MLVMVGVGAWCGAGVLVAWVVVLAAAMAAAVVAVVAVTKAAAEMAVEAAMTVVAMIAAVLIAAVVAAVAAAAPAALYPLAPPAPTVVLKGGVDWGGIGEGAPARGSSRRFGFLRDP